MDVASADVLDVGCSFGWFAALALERGARSVVGVDVTNEALRLAQKHAPKANFVRATALALPLDDARFDIVAAFDVLEHLPVGSEPVALRELRRVLRTSGRLALSTPNRSRFATFTDPAFYVGHRHYRPGRLIELLQESGFAVERVAFGGRLLDQADLLLYYLWRHVVRRERHPFERLRRWAEREWTPSVRGNTILVVARPVRAGGR